MAAQYGEKEARRKPSAKAAEKVERRARMDAREREQRRQLMTPDDDLMKRLARAGAITTTLKIDEDGATRTKTVRRSRKWESRCGKCGVSSTFSTSAALCVKCGAIAVRQ